MSKVRVGIIGCGYWGPKHARNFNEIADSELAWACDLWPERLDHIKKLYPHVQTTRDYREVLRSDVDAIVLATPVYMHAPLAIEAMQAGKHVLVEKPLAAGVKEASRMVDEADRQKRVLMVGHTFEYNPAVEAMKQIIASGELGKIYYINGTRVNLGLFQPDINVLWDLAPHDVSILLYTLGMDPEMASARGGVYVQQEKHIHDVAYLTIYFPTGILADVRVSWLDPCKIRSYTVVGSKKMLVYDDVQTENKIMIYDKGVDVPPYSDTEEEFRLSYRYGEVQPYPIQWVEPLRIECEHFVHCVQTGEEPRSSGRSGLKVVRVLEAAQRSLLNGGEREAIDW